MMAVNSRARLRKCQFLQYLRRALHGIIFAMQSLRSARFLARLALVWFALAGALPGAFRVRARCGLAQGPPIRLACP
jgi:hypothetical protein